jgi:hypothetical protein
MKKSLLLGLFLLFFGGCATTSDIEKRFVLKTDLDNLIMQANYVIQAHSAAIKGLQDTTADKKTEKAK